MMSSPGSRSPTLLYAVKTLRMKSGRFYVSGWLVDLHRALHALSLHASTPLGNDRHAVHYGTLREDVARHY